MFDISPIPAFDDNYIWCLRDDHHCWVVDPGDPAPVLSHLNAHNLSLRGILVTHHHFDHTGGIAPLRAAFPDATVYGPDNPAISGLTRTLGDGDVIQLGDTEFRIIAVPGHTLDHIAYYGDGLLFCGDTLFAGGCGRMFEGTAPVMQNSLARLSALADDTRVYCAHEYTLANLAFARAVEPNNADLARREAKAIELREHDTPTVPSTIGLERATNPFLRWHDTSVAQAAHHFSAHDGTPAGIFGALREWKDGF